MQVIPELLRELRHERGLSQRALAARTGDEVSLTTVAFLELGERQPSRLTAEALAAALGVPLTAFCKVLVPRPGDDAVPVTEMPVASVPLPQA